MPSKRAYILKNLMKVFFFHKKTSSSIILVKKEFNRAFTKWSERYQKVFETIKNYSKAKSLTTINYNYEKTIYVIINTSLIGIEAVLNLLSGL